MGGEAMLDGIVEIISATFLITSHTSAVAVIAGIEPSKRSL
jgi:hypothetical protein